MLKQKFLEISLKSIKNTKKYDSYQLDKITYGLEVLYLTITKIIFILILSYFLAIIKEVLLVITFFNILRFTGFGFHAPKSWICWILSTSFFIGGTYLCKIIIIPKYFLLVISCVGTIMLAIYAPADTEKRPLINKEKRKKYKIFTIILACFYIIVILLSNVNLFNKILTFCIILETIMILPISYKILKLSYNNYINYNNKN